MVITKDIAKIFWTGGWDSTFRVLYLAIVEKRKVQPYYILGLHSKSPETLAMELIKEKMFEIYPETKHLIQPTIFIEVGDIAENEEIKQSFIKSQEKHDIEPQYYYMARFAKENELDDIEVCLTTETTILSHILSNDSMRIDQKYFNTDLYKIYGYGSFPLIHMTKPDMKKIATEFNFIELLNKSWFCNFPIKGEPCGICSSCMLIMEEKMHERMPFISRVRYYTSPKRYLKSFLKKHPRYTHKIKKLLGEKIIKLARR